MMKRNKNNNSNNNEESTNREKNMRSYTLLYSVHIQSTHIAVQTFEDEQIWVQHELWT